MNFGFAPRVMPQGQRVRTSHCRLACTPAISGNRRHKLNGLPEHLLARSAATRSFDTERLAAQPCIEGRFTLPAPDVPWFERLGCAPFAVISVDRRMAHRAKVEGLQA
jgi:hypothetical protein